MPEDYVVIDNTGDEINSILAGTGSSPQGEYYDLVDTIDGHIENGEIHVTAAQKNMWNGKASPSTTLSGYGITDAYTKSEVNSLLLEKANKNTTLSGYGITDAYTKTEIDNRMNGSLHETVLCETTVQTPVWENQPTVVSGDISTFDTSTFYYVTLKDGDGQDLPSGQFMLKESYAVGSTVYDVVFSLTNLQTGSSSSTQLMEDFPVEITQTSNGKKFRDAGVRLVRYDDPIRLYWDLGGQYGKLKVKIIGSIAQRSVGDQYYLTFGTDQYVSSYSLSGSQSVQFDSTDTILTYVATGATGYKNTFLEESYIERAGTNRYTTRRMVSMRFLPNGETDNYTSLEFNVPGYGSLLSISKTHVVSVGIWSVYGFIRNGTFIRITEVG